MIKPGEKTKFFFKNLLRGLVWLGLLLLFFLIARKYSSPDIEELLEPFFQNTLLIFTIYCLSEIIFGIIPPELFMIWALRTGNLIDYSLLILLFAFLSYAAGFLGYTFGKFLSSTIVFRFVRRRYLAKYQTLFQKYGAFLILVAAVTPLPFSAISMLAGSFQYSAKNYLFWALSRFIRFGVYAIIIWEANLV